MKFWNYGMFGTDVYHLVCAFIIYSMLGWLVESIYMSFCNRKLTNRGYAMGPFCPIYGFGAVSGYLFLNNFRFNPFLVYVLAAVTATTFEFIVGKVMIKIFGELWWDYNNKPFNYKGIICLESTVAWGFYGIGVVYFLHGKLMQLVDKTNLSYGVKIIVVILAIAVVDYIIQTVRVARGSVSAPKNAVFPKEEKIEEEA